MQVIDVGLFMRVCFLTSTVRSSMGAGREDSTNRQSLRPPPGMSVWPRLPLPTATTRNCFTYWLPSIESQSSSRAKGSMLMIAGASIRFANKKEQRTSEACPLRERRRPEASLTRFNTKTTPSWRLKRVQVFELGTQDSHGRRQSL